MNGVKAVGVMTVATPNSSLSNAVPSVVDEHNSSTRFLPPSMALSNAACRICMIVRDAILPSKRRSGRNGVERKVRGEYLPGLPKGCECCRVQGEVPTD